ncbi:MAG: sulfite exporter TauE/SafE family protein [Chromatiales bacterium]|nr:sulfite exporter TauE/SafE family protein [Chromatiales bacterium]
MYELPLSPAVLATVALGGFIQGLAGFGAGLVAVPLLMLQLPAGVAVPMFSLLATLGSAMNVLHLRHAVNFRPLLLLLGGYVIGAPLGLLYLTKASQTWVMAGLGAFLTLYALYALSGRRPDYRWLREQRLALGMCSGALGAAFSTNGPPVILHVAAQDWDTERQKAILSLYFLLSGLLTSAVHAIGGLLDQEVLLATAVAVLPLILGVSLGIAVYRRLSAHNYRRLTFLLVLTMGVLLITRVFFV